MGLIGFIVAIGAPFLCVPQMIEILKHKSAKDVSISTWLFCAISSIYWIVHGYQNNDMIVMVSGIMWTVSQSLVTVLATWYKYRT